MTILTDDEIFAINEQHYNIAFRNFESDVAIARAIESAVLAKLREQEFPGWIPLSDRRPEPEVYVLAWDGKKVSVDWWGSLPKPSGTEYTHWMPFPKPPGINGRSMYGMQSLAAVSEAPAQIKEQP